MSHSNMNKKIDKYYNCSFHMPWRYISFYSCAYKEKTTEWFYSKCKRDSSRRNYDKCNINCPNFKPRFIHKLKACWIILTKGFKLE